MIGERRTSLARFRSLDIGAGALCLGYQKSLALGSEQWYGAGVRHV